MNKLLLFIFLFMVSCSKKKHSNNETNTRIKNKYSNLSEEKLNSSKFSSDFDFLLEKFSSDMVYQAILCISKENRVAYTDSISWSQIPYAAKNFTYKQELLNLKINLKRIESFCYLSISLKTPFIYDFDEPFYFEELIYKLNLTNDIITKFFNHSNQSWESLSSSQRKELYYRTILYLTSIKPKEQLNYLNSYYQLVKKLNLNPSK